MEEPTGLFSGLLLVPELACAACLLCFAAVLSSSFFGAALAHPVPFPIAVMAFALAAFSVATIRGADGEDLVGLAPGLALALGLPVVLQRRAVLHAVCLIEKDVHDVIHRLLLAIGLGLCQEWRRVASEVLLSRTVCLKSSSLMATPAARSSLRCMVMLGRKARTPSFSHCMLTNDRWRAFREYALLAELLIDEGPLLLSGWILPDFQHCRVWEPLVEQVPGGSVLAVTTLYVLLLRGS